MKTVVTAGILNVTDKRPSLSVSIRDQYYKLIPNFPDSHLILQFSRVPVRA